MGTMIETPLSPIAATSLDLRYDMPQDRLLLTARTAAQGIDLHLTRRLTRAMISALLDLLMRTSDLVARSGPDHRSDVLLFEHMEAVSRVTASPLPVSHAKPELAAEIHAQAPRLIEKVDVTPVAGALRLSLHDDQGERAWIVLPRERVHQFISMLMNKSRDAGWDLDDPAWTDRRGQFVLPESARLC
jgi:hypothetical protein